MEDNKWKKHDDFIEEMLNLSSRFIWINKPPQIVEAFFEGRLSSSRDFCAPLIGGIQI